jgi:hypothetical protein
MNDNPQSPRTRLITVSSWEQHHDWPRAGGLRNLIFNKHKNGFAAVVRKVGKRVLIDENAFFEWVANQGQTGGAHEKVK